MSEEGEGSAPDLREYGRTVLRHRWLLVITVVLAVGAAIGLSSLQTPIYEATAQIIVQPSRTQQILNDSAGQNAQDAARNVETETAVLRSKAVQNAAARRLGHSTDVTVSSRESSDVVSVTARSSNPRRAAADANGYAAAYVALRRQQNIADLAQAGEQIQAKIAEIDQRIPDLESGSPEASSASEQRGFLQQQLDRLEVSASLSEVGGARILARAEVPSSPVEPKPLRNAAIAFVLGLLAAIGLAFLREFFDDTIVSREDLQRATDGLPVLGQIPRVTGWRDREAAHVVTLDAPTSVAAEGYRKLRTAIQFLEVTRSLKSLQITSSRTDDGKTTTLANLAISFARVGSRVTIVCCDFRQPRVHEFFGLSNEVGFTSVLLGQTSVLDALQPVPGEANLSVLSAGPSPPNPSELLASPRAFEVISRLEKSSDFVLVDSPPVLPVADGLIVSGMVDATMLVASAKSSSRRALQRSVQVLRQVDAALVGTVLNNAGSSESFGGDEYGYVANPVPAPKRAGTGSRRSSRHQPGEMFGS